MQKKTYNKSWCPADLVGQSKPWCGINGDNRIWYWTGGEYKVGDRVVARGGSSREEAEKKLRQIANDIERGGSLNIDEGTTWSVLLARWVEEHDTDREGTIRTRKSAIDAVLIPAIGDVLIVRTSRATLAKVVDHCLHKTGIGERRYDTVMQTLSVVVQWATQREYLMRSPFGDSDEVSEATRLGRKRIRNARSTGAKQVKTSYSRQDVPTWAVIQLLAKAVEFVVRRTDNCTMSARRLAAGVRVAAGTGLRECELLGLIDTDVDFVNGYINLWRQLDRYSTHGSHMVYGPLKSSDRMDKSSPQRVRVWKKVEKDLKFLVKNAAPTGELFVMPSKAQCKNVITWWEQRTKTARTNAGFAWPLHILRHHYGSYSTATREEGGMGMSYAAVQKSMGHKSLKTTMETYIHSVNTETEGWVE
jgi:integrase